jgi:hypothetical protein
MKDKTYTLWLNDQQVAAINPVGYDTPEYSGMCQFSDKALQEKMLKACGFSQWASNLAENEDLSDEEYDQEIEKQLVKQDLAQEDLNTYEKGKWTVAVSDGTVMKMFQPNFYENGGISWRPYD